MMMLDENVPDLIFFLQMASLNNIPVGIAILEDAKNQYPEWFEDGFRLKPFHAEQGKPRSKWYKAYEKRKKRGV